MILDSSFIELGTQLYYSSSFPLPYHAVGLFWGGGECGGEWKLNTGEEGVCSFALGWWVAFCSIGFVGVFFSGTNATAAAHIQHCHFAG